MTEVNNAAPAGPGPDELVEVTSIPQFAGLVAQWHANIVGQLRQGVIVPDDVGISVCLVPGEPERELNADERTGFKAGLIMALALFEELPFSGMLEEVPATALGDEGTAQ